MVNISSLSESGAAAPVSIAPAPAAARSRKPAGEDGLVPARVDDRIELSAEARLAAQRPVRHELIDRVRSEIAQGTYDSDDKLEYVAQKLGRLLDRDA